ncbi:hypothetical protein [Methanocrinis sp.]|uniref:hypothetical protein n=1 Tax=Methanocrinis sp. TaxID=3101522 RepID=UPI003D0ADDD4
MAPLTSRRRRRPQGGDPLDGAFSLKVAGDQIRNLGDIFGRADLLRGGDLPLGLHLQAIDII